MKGWIEMAITVKLLQYTPEPEKVVSAAAKLCYSSSGVENILDGLTEEKTDKFLETYNLPRLNHEETEKYLIVKLKSEQQNKKYTNKNTYIKIIYFKKEETHR